MTLIDPLAVFATYPYGKSIEGRLGTVVGDTVYKRTNRLRGDCLHSSSPRVALEPKKEVSGTVAAERYAVRVVPVKTWRRTNNCAHDASGFVGTSSLYVVEKPSVYRGVEQLAARHPHKVEVAGSSPVPATRVALPKNKCRGERQRGSGEGEKVEALPGFDSRWWRGARCHKP